MDGRCSPAMTVGTDRTGCLVQHLGPATSETSNRLRKAYAAKSQPPLPGVQGAEADDTDITRSPVLFLLF